MRKVKGIEPYESFYHDASEAFDNGILGGGISRCVKTTDSLATMVEVKQQLTVIQNGEEKPRWNLRTSSRVETKTTLTTECGNLMVIAVRSIAPRRWKC
jgi:hypothetical protein